MPLIQFPAAIFFNWQRQRQPFRYTCDRRIEWAKQAFSLHTNGLTRIMVCLRFPLIRCQSFLLAAYAETLMQSQRRKNMCSVVWKNIHMDRIPHSYTAQKIVRRLSRASKLPMQYFQPSCLFSCRIYTVCITHSLQ